MGEKELINDYNNNLGIIMSAGEYLGKKFANERVISIADEAYHKLQYIIDSADSSTPILRAISAKKPQADKLGDLLSGLKRNNFSYTKDLQETINSLLLEDYRKSKEAAEVREALGQIKLYLETPKNLKLMKRFNSLWAEHNRVVQYGKNFESQAVQEETDTFAKLFPGYIQNLKTNFSDKPNLLYKSVQRLEELLKP